VRPSAARPLGRVYYTDPTDPEALLMQALAEHTCQLDPWKAARLVADTANRHGPRVAAVLLLCSSEEEGSS